MVLKKYFNLIFNEKKSIFDFYEIEIVSSDSDDISDNNLENNSINSLNINSDLTENDLSEDDLSQDDLSQDDLSEDDLSQDDLSQDDLSQDDLSQDDLSQDDLSKDDLSEDDLSQDDLSQDDLSEDDLSEDDLSEDDLSEDEKINHGVFYIPTGNKNSIYLINYIEEEFEIKTKYITNINDLNEGKDTLELIYNKINKIGECHNNDINKNIKDDCKFAKPTLAILVDDNTNIIEYKNIIN